jgi:metal-dependent amidase/aminoacylase/carboxypeptidase family protein
MIDLKKAVARRRDNIIAIRRALHQIPEVGYTEQKTSRFVADQLERLGIEVRSGIARFGVVGLQRFSSSGKTLMLRSELDALPIVEQTGLPFASTHPGPCTPAAMMAIWPWCWAPPWCCVILIRHLTAR